MSSISERLDAWRTIANATRVEELEEVIAGRSAEKSLQAMFDAKLFFKKSCILHSKRVPYHSNNKRGRYEIDLVVLTQKQISAIEIKNWSGSVTSDGENWIQTRRDGSKIVHSDPIKKNKRKLDILCDYLEMKGCTIPKLRVSRVIQWNSKLSIDSQLSNNSDLILHSQLERFLNAQKGSSFGERILHSVLTYCMDQENSKVALDGFFGAISEDEYSNCVAQIGDLHNFDKIELFGGRIISGDLLKLNLKDKTFDLKQLIKGQKVEILCIRTKLILFFLAVFGKGSLFTLTKPYEKIKVRPTDTILFHCAGEPHPQEFNLANIKSFQRG
jgi:hypothetical protein